MKRMENLVYSLCQEIDMLKDEIEYITEDRDYWRDKYNNMLNGTLQSSQKMVAGILDSLLDKGNDNV